VAKPGSRSTGNLSADFCHVIYIPTEIHPLGGVSNGKRPSLERLSLIAEDFEILLFDTSELIVHKAHAGVQIPIRFYHRRTGAMLETKIANFCTFEDNWPVKLSEYHDISRIQAFAASLAALTAI
jgi:hypothetical protein